MFSKRVLGLWAVAVVCGLALTGGVPAQKIEYPRVNVATVWKVDAKWPQKPKELLWGHVPGIAVDGKDRVYISTRAKPPIQVYDANGKYLRGWGEKTIDNPHHIKVGPDGNIWVSDTGNHVIQKYTPEGKLLMTLGNSGKAGRDKNHFNRPTDMAITKDGEIFVSDGYGNHRVVHFDSKGNFVNEWGDLGSQPGQFNLPHAIAVDSKGQVYVADRNNVRVQVFNRKGDLLAVWDNLIVPWGFHVTDKDEIWVCGSSPMQWRKTDNALGCPPKDQVFMKFSPEGKLLHLFTLPKGLDGLERPGEVNWVHCIALDSRGNMYLGDIIGKRAQKFVIQRP